MSAEVVFALGEQQFTWDDVVIAARSRGTWSRLARQAAEGLACLQRLVAEGGDISNEVDDAADRFRYERNLLSADETLAWLSSRRISVEQWRDFLRRALLRAKWAGQLRAIERAHPVDEQSLDDALWPEGILSGILPGAAEQLASWAAAAAALQATDAPTDPGIGQMRGQRIGRLARAFGRFTKHVATPAAIGAAMLSHRLDWTRIRYRHAAFADQGAAAEAAAEVRFEGRPLPIAAAAADVHVAERYHFVDEVASDLVPWLASAQAGELIGPLALTGAFWLVEVLERVEPSAQNELVRGRARKAVISRAVEWEVRDRVRWHERF